MHFFNALNVEDRDVAKLVNDLQVHVAIDQDLLDIQYSRVAVFSQRPAPVQIQGTPNSIGCSAPSIQEPIIAGAMYDDTSGTDWFDFMFADRTYIPPELSSHALGILSGQRAHEGACFAAGRGHLFR